MKIIVLHGDNNIKSYERLNKFIEVAKSRSWEIVRQSSTNQNLQEVISSSSLFSVQKLIIADNLKSLDKKFSEWIKREADNFETTLIVYHTDLLSKTFLKSLPDNIKVEEFKLPTNIWNFMDSFYPGNLRNTLILFNDCVKKEPVELIFSLLVRHFRDLFLIKTDPASLNYPSWRISKLKRQASRYKEGQLEIIIKELADADMASKTSQSTLKDSLDFIIATRLE